MIADLTCEPPEPQNRDGLMAPLLDIRDLQIRFRAIEAVRGLILNLDEGEVPGLVGESNSEKAPRRWRSWVCWEIQHRLPARICGKAHRAHPQRPLTTQAPPASGSICCSNPPVSYGDYAAVGSR